MMVDSRDKAAGMLTPAQLAAMQAKARTWQPTPEPQRSPTAMPATPPPLPPLPAPSPRIVLIRQAQQRLQAQGFDPGAIDGVLGQQTQQAIRWFQNSVGLLPTGELDARTLEALGVR